MTRSPQSASEQTRRSLWALARLWWTFALLMVGLMDLRLCAASAPARQVFAHYMVCFATYGATLQGYAREIREAQAAGIDGFALNVGAWSGPETFYQERVGLIHRAAQAVGGGFRLFFSVEFTNSFDVVDMVSRYASHASALRHEGRLVLSSYGQNRTAASPGVDWRGVVFPGLAAKGIDVFFVPHFWPEPVAELPDRAAAERLIRREGDILGGLFLFGAAGLPEDLARSNAGYTRAAQASGKLSMAGVTPQYWGCYQPSAGRRYFEFHGAEGLSTQWNSILATRPEWVEIVTWNDWNEGTYVSPVEDPARFFPGLRSPERPPHDGYLALCSHYIRWFKSGIETAPDREALICTQRLHARDVAPRDPREVRVTRLVGDVRDELHLTLLLREAADVGVGEGSLIAHHPAAAGVSHLRVPAGRGVPVVNVSRAGRSILQWRGRELATNPPVQNFFCLSKAVFAPHSVSAH